MSRSISQIYSEAVKNRNNYLQLTELNSGKSNGKLSIMNLMTYVMATLIYTYESILDVFEVDVAALITKRINGTAQYYVEMAKKFQFDINKNTGDVLVFDTDTWTIRYETPDLTHRIITQAAWGKHFSDTASKNEDGILLKVCKENDDDNSIKNGTIYKPLTAAELSAFKSYIYQIKFLGAHIYPISIPGDRVFIKKCKIDYDDRYITEEQAFENVKAALIEYSKNLGYDDYVYYQSIIDTINSAEYITNIQSGTVISISSYNYLTSAYEAEQALTDRQKASSGYITFTGADGKILIQKAVGYLEFVKTSEDTTTTTTTTA